MVFALKGQACGAYPGTIATGDRALWLSCTSGWHVLHTRFALDPVKQALVGNPFAAQLRRAVHVVGVSLSSLTQRVLVLTFHIGTGN